MNRWELPEGWEWTTLGEIAIVTGGMMKGRRRDPDERLRAVPYLRVANVQRGFLDLSEVKTIEATEEEIDALRLQPGDVLFNEGGDRDQLGRGWVWQGELPECIHQNHVFRARLRSPDVSPHLLSMWGNSYGQAYFIESGSQTTNLASISMKNLRALPIPLPPPDEQTRIVARLNDLQARIASARAGLDELRELAAALKRSVLDAAFRGELTAAWREAHPLEDRGDVPPRAPPEGEGLRALAPRAEPASALLDRLRAERRRRWQEAHPKKPYVAPEPVDATDLPELPEGWCWAALEEVSEPVLGKMLDKAKNKGSPHPYLRNQNVRWGAFDLSDVQDMLFEEDEAERYGLRPGDVLICEGGEPGRAAVWRETASNMRFQKALHRVRCCEVLCPDWLVYQLAHLAGNGALADHCTGTGILHLTGQSLARLPIALPPPSEQLLCARAINQSWSTANHTLATAQALIDDLTTTERALLTAAFRGELLPPADP